MPGKATLKTLAALILLAVAVLFFRSWLESHDDQLQLKATLEAQQKLMSAADTREQNRATELKDTLAQIASEKRATQTPQQIANALRQLIPFPQPIELTNIRDAAGQQRLAGQESEKGTAASAIPTSSTVIQMSGRQELPASPSLQSSPQSATNELTAELPAADLKPLYDFVQDCRACQAKLSAANADLSDEKVKSAALGKERDAAVRASKGGNLWTRLRRNARWFAVGAGFGAVAAIAARR